MLLDQERAVGAKPLKEYNEVKGYCPAGPARCSSRPEFTMIALRRGPAPECLLEAADRPRDARQIAHIPSGRSATDLGWVQ
jgi:hypothetical protein